MSVGIFRKDIGTKCNYFLNAESTIRKAIGTLIKKIQQNGYVGNNFIEFVIHRKRIISSP